MMPQPDVVRAMSESRLSLTQRPARRSWATPTTGFAAYDGIGLWSSTLSTVIGNNIGGFTINAKRYAQIYLDPLTTHDRVVCAEPSDTLLNQGTVSIVNGCRQAAATSDAAPKIATPAGSTAKPGVPKRKPWLR